MYTEQIPCPLPEKISFVEQSVILEHVFEIVWIGDYDARRKGWYRNFVSFETKSLLALGEPLEELVAGLKEGEGIAKERKGVRRSPGEYLVSDSAYTGIVTTTYGRLFPLRSILGHRACQINATRRAAATATNKNMAGHSQALLTMTTTQALILYHLKVKPHGKSSSGCRSET